MKTFKFLTTWLMILVCISFSSCSSDDDKDDDNGKGNNKTEASIVGTWQYKEDNEYIMLLSINKDGTFMNTEKEYYNGKWDTAYDSGMYKYSKNTLTFTSEDGETWSFKVISVPSTSLTVDDEGDIYVYTRL